MSKQSISTKTQAWLLKPILFVVDCVINLEVMLRYGWSAYQAKRNERL